MGTIDAIALVAALAALVARVGRGADAPYPWRPLRFVSTLSRRVSAHASARGGSPSPGANGRGSHLVDDEPVAYRI